MNTFQIGKNGAKWALDASLKSLALELVNDFSEEVGYVDLGRVVFGRVEGMGEKWAGKTYYVAPPVSMLPIYTLELLVSRGMHVSEEDTGLLSGIAGINFMIFLGTDYLAQFIRDDRLIRQQEKILLFHEMLHIKPEMDGLRGHDIKDFKTLVDKFGAYWDEGVVK